MLKPDLLQPGQSNKLRFQLTAKDIASFNTNALSWIAEAGNYTVKMGLHRTILQTSTFQCQKKYVTEKCNKVLVPQVHVNESKKGF